MTKYKVTIAEHRYYDIEVEAASRDEADRKATELVDNGKAEETQGRDLELVSIEPNN